MSTTVRPEITPSIQPKVTRFQLSESWRRRLPLLPALLIMIVLTQVPFVMSVYYSFTDWKVVPPEPRNWVGLDNYNFLLHDHFFKDATVTSIQLTVFPVLGAIQQEREAQPQHDRAKDGEHGQLEIGRAHV